MLLVVLAHFANVQHVDLLFLEDFCELLSSHFFDGIHILASGFPGFKTTFEVANGVVIAHTGQADDHLFFTAWFADEEDGLIQIGDERTNPGSKLPVQSYEDGTGDETFGVLIFVAGIDDQGIFTFPGSFESANAERMDAFFQRGFLGKYCTA